MPIFDQPPGTGIGTVYSVDTSSVTVRVPDGEKLRSLQVNHLVAIRSSKAGQHLIGLIQKIMRKAVDPPEQLDQVEELPAGVVLVENVVRLLLIGTLIDRVGTQPNVFRRTLETVPEIDAECYALEGENLTAFMRAISKDAENRTQALSLGHYTLDENAEAWLDGNRFFQRHAVIVGSTGSGKSWTVARILEQVSRLANANAILFDIHGEYAPLVGDEFQHLRIAGPADISAGRGLDDGVLFLPYWLLGYEEMLSMMLDRSDQNAPNQAMLFTREVTEAKREQLDADDKAEVLANFTIDSPVPYDLESVIHQLETLDTQMVPGAGRKEKQGPFHGKLTRFLQRLNAKKSDRRLGFLFDLPSDAMSYSWMPKLCKRLLCGGSQHQYGGVKIIDFSEVPSDVLPLILGLVARIVFSVQQWTERQRRHPISIFCDEAHLYIPERIGGDSLTELGYQSFERIAKEGRKYGLGLVVISQRPSEVNQTVMSQCNNYVAMRLTNAQDQASIRRLLPDSLGGIPDLLPILDIGEALVVGDASLLPSRIRIEAPQQKPASATVDFWDKWRIEQADEAITLAVESLRRQSKQD